MAFKFIQTNNCNVRLRCTIQATGKLSFTTDTAEALHLCKDKLVKFAIDDEDEMALYLIFVLQKDNDTFRIVKSGKYYNIQTQGLFDMLQYDYRHITYIYDMSRAAELDQEANGEVYKMVCRKINKRNKDSVASL